MPSGIEVGRASRLQDLPDAGGGPLVSCSRLLVALLLLLSCNTCEICLYSHFKGVFRGFWGADVYLCGLRSLRGLRGFCVRERLGG